MKFFTAFWGGHEIFLPLSFKKKYRQKKYFFHKKKKCINFPRFPRYFPDFPDEIRNISGKSEIGVMARNDGDIKISPNLRLSLLYIACVAIYLHHRTPVHFQPNFKCAWLDCRRHFLTKLTKTQNVDDNVILVCGIDKLLCVKYKTWARTFNAVFFHENFFLIIFYCPAEAESQFVSVQYVDQGSLVSCKCPKEITFLFFCTLCFSALCFTPLAFVHSLKITPWP